MKPPREWELDTFVDARRQTRDGEEVATGELKITVAESGEWAVRVTSEDQSFTLILMGDAKASVPVMLHQTFSFLFGQAA